MPWSAPDSVRQDVRYALRMMRRGPVFTAVTVLSLALGIGANTAIFSVMNTLMLRRLPVSHPERLVVLLGQYPGEPRGSWFSRSSYEYYRDRNHVFSGLTGLAGSPFNVRGGEVEPEVVDGAFVTRNFFHVLGVKPAMGRLIADAEDSPVAVVSWSYWTRNPAVLGKQIIVDDTPLSVIGVLPPAFSGVLVGLRTDVWVPFAEEPVIHRPSRIGMGGLALLARLRPGVSMTQAQAEMRVLFRYTLEERIRNSKDPLERQLKFELAPAGSGFSPLRDQLSAPLLVLMILVGLLLLITCTNIASMLLARAASRRHEMAVRVSLGAGRRRLVRQVVTESLLLSAAGGFLGILLAQFGARALIAVLSSSRPIPGMERLQISVQPDVHVVLFTAAIAFLAGLLFGLAPAWNISTCTPGSSLRQTGMAGESRLSRLFGKGLVAAQVALSVVLLSAAGLFVRHLEDLEHVDLGFQREGVLVVTLDPAHSGYIQARLSALRQQLLRRFEAIPGVRSATISGSSPLSGAGASQFVTVEGHSERMEDRRYISLAWVAPRYFATLRIPMLAGRDFRAGDRDVTIINRAMARYYFGGADPIGRLITTDDDHTSYRIVGVVGNTKYYEIREAPVRTMYLPDSDGHTFLLRTGINPSSIAANVRATARAVLPTVPVARMTTLARQVDATIVPERLIALLSGSFGALGAVLAAIGLYGLLAYTVARRVREIGIRLALGATRGHVIRMVLGDALLMLCAGLVIGAPAAVWAGQLGARVIPGLSPPRWPIAFGVAAMITIALMAAYLPARRAARVDPIDALRHE